jgi:hypothetical protein
MAADLKPRPRLRDPALMRRLHAQPDECRVCGRPGVSLHHILSRGLGGDDVEENLAWLCGSGTTGCHGLIEAHDPVACYCFGDALLNTEVEYVLDRLGTEPGFNFLVRRYLYDPCIGD